MKRLKVEAQRKDAELRRAERALEAHESAALFETNAPLGGGGASSDQKALVKALKGQVRGRA